MENMHSPEVADFEKIINQSLEDIESFERNYPVQDVNDLSLRFEKIKKIYVDSYTLFKRIDQQVEKLRKNWENPN
jgi:hypothetical protein